MNDDTLATLKYFREAYKLAIYQRDPEDYDNGTYTVRRKCSECEQAHTDTIPGSALFQYRQGAFIQNAFPMLSAADREFYFKSGICGSCLGTERG